MGNRQKRPLKLFLIRLMQGALIGLGAVLPGISGGVLCVVFGIYQPIMELLSHPFRALKKHAEMLLPVLIGLCAGFLGIAKLLGFLLNRYPDASVCLFAGLIIGMLPSLFREGRKKGSSPKDYAALGITFAVVLGPAYDAAVCVCQHNGKRRVVCIVRILSCFEHNCARHELFHAFDAARAVYAFC